MALSGLGFCFHTLCGGANVRRPGDFIFENLAHARGFESRVRIPILGEFHEIEQNFGAEISQRTDRVISGAWIPRSSISIKLKDFIGRHHDPAPPGLLQIVSRSPAPTQIYVHSTSKLRRKFTSELRRKFTSKLRRNFTSKLRRKFTSQLRRKFTSKLRRNLTSKLRRKFTSKLRRTFTSKLRRNFTSKFRRKCTSNLRPSSDVDLRLNLGVNLRPRPGVNVDLITVQFRRESTSKFRRTCTSNLRLSSRRGSRGLAARLW